MPHILLTLIFLFVDFLRECKARASLQHLHPARDKTPVFEAIVSLSWLQSGGQVFWPRNPTVPSGLTAGRWPSQNGPQLEFLHGLHSCTQGKCTCSCYFISFLSESISIFFFLKEGKLIFPLCFKCHHTIHSRHTNALWKDHFQSVLYICCHQAIFFPRHLKPPEC